jgi:hypothetical protein
MPATQTSSPRTGLRHAKPTYSISVAPSRQSPREVAREFRGLLDSGARLRVSGSAASDPHDLFARGYSPRYKVVLFGTPIYLADLRQNPDIRFFVAYVVQTRRSRTEVFARIFYKDVSLIWRSASHVVRSDNENWIGKGDVVEVTIDGRVFLESDEATTDLPLELQDALEDVSRRARIIRRDNLAITRVLRNGPDDRVAPYRDFTAPRRLAAADPTKRVHDGRRIAWFTRAGDPDSLRFAPGFAPDFSGGVIEQSHSQSTLYGGTLHRFRILSANRRIQYLFFAGPRHVWIIPPQATTPEITSFAVRPVSVAIDDALCVPGFEYHYLDESVDPPVFVSQIPVGYAGQLSTVDPSRADASPWLDRLPVIREFRRTVLRRGKRAGKE